MSIRRPGVAPIASFAALPQGHDIEMKKFIDSGLATFEHFEVAHQPANGLFAKFGQHILAPQAAVLPHG